MENSLMVVWLAAGISPIMSVPAAASHKLPFASAAISCADALLVGIGMSGPNWPLIVMLPIAFPPISVNHNVVPSDAIPPGLPCHGDSAMAPLGVILPIALPPTSVNQTLPSGPNVIENG